MRRAIREWFGGAADGEIRALEEVPGIEPERLRELWCAEADLMLRVDRLYASSQRAFERRTRVAVGEDLLRALRAVAQGADVGRLETAVELAGSRLESDTVTAGARGLNIGLTCGVAVSPVVLVVVFVVGRWVPGLFGSDFGSDFGCQEQQALVHALVCFAGGAMGAAFSVIIRLRDPRRLLRAQGRLGKLAADPVQLSQSLRQEGWYRVVVGWFLATSLFLLVNGGLVTVLVPPVVPPELCGPGELTAAGHEALIKAWFFWGSIGFLAGLNERWAHGLLRHPSSGRDDACREDDCARRR